MKQKVASKANLIALLDQTYPGVTNSSTAPHAPTEAKSGWIMPIHSGMWTVSVRPV